MLPVVQTDSLVVVTVMVKGIAAEKVQAQFSESALSVNIDLPAGGTYKCVLPPCACLCSCILIGLSSIAFACHVDTTCAQSGAGSVAQDSAR